MTGQELGKRGEEKVAGWLRGRGLHVSLMPYRHPYDIECNGKRIEVKTLRAHMEDGVPTWEANIHRHGVLDESNADLYVLRLEDFPGMEYALHLVVPAPIGTMTVSLTMRNLILHWSQYAKNLEPLTGEKADRVLAE